MGAYWRFRLAVSETSVPDSIVETWICEPSGTFRFPLSQMHDLLAGRPALLPAAVAAGGRASAGAAGSLHLTVSMAETLLSSANVRTPAGRAALRELAVNLQLPNAVRGEALAYVTRHWPAGRRATAHAELNASQVPPPGPNPDLRTMAEAEITLLLAWASGKASIGLGQAREDGPKPALLTALVESDRRASRSLFASDIKFPDWQHWRASGLPRRSDLPMLELPAAVAAWDDTGLVAAACTAGLRTSEWWLPRSRASAAGHYVRRRLGTDVAAWETFAALRAEWCGNVEELMTASLTL